MPVRYILSSVWVRLSIFSQLSIMQYMGLCVFSLPISLVMTERMSYYHNQIGNMNHYPLFRVRSWNNGVRCMSLYILMLILYNIYSLSQPSFWIMKCSTHNFRWIWIVIENWLHCYWNGPQKHKTPEAIMNSYKVCVGNTRWSKYRQTNDKTNNKLEECM